jgi:prepilin-type N-terminal cleavage/methylation domain-containing protein
MKSNRAISRHGYTIIESLITIMIVGVIGIVAIPRFSAAANEPVRAEAVKVLQDICAAADSVKSATGSYPAILDVDGGRQTMVGEEYGFGYRAGVAVAMSRDPSATDGLEVVALEMDCTSRVTM